ncbi:MAG: ABC transporter substrate-binding protein [Deltaproteobacteria bacterium]|nr:ABC transporter substrate-binding protein [Deltaproteobacteria bacterium]
MDSKKMAEKLAVALLVILMATMFMPVCGEAAFSRNLVIGYEGDPDTLDMCSTRHAPTAIPIAANVMERLFQITTDGETVPGLASWTIAPDKMSIDFKLRKGVKFHSGDSLTTKDVIFSYKRILEKTTATGFRWVKDIEIIDDMNFRVLFKQPDVLFLKDRSFFIGSKSYFDRVGEAEFNKKVVGTGPYRVINWRAAEFVELERFDDYWGEKPEIKNVRLHFIKEGTTRISMLKAGEADMITSVPYAMVKDLERSGFKTIKLAAHPTTQVQFQFMNPNVPWHDKRVRLAIAHAIDGDAIVKSLLHGIPARVWLSPWELGYDPSLKLWEYDPKKAKQLLAEAGYAKGFEMPLYYWAGRTTGQKETAEAVALYLKAIGIKCTMIGWEPVKMIESIRIKWHNNPEAVHVGVATPPIAHQTDPVYGFRTSYYSESTISLYNNPEFDKIYLKASQEFDDAKRAELIKQGMRIIADDVATIPIWANVSVYALKKDIDFTPTLRAMDALVLVKDIKIRP